MKKIFLGNFSCKDDIIKDFRLDNDEIDDINILFAGYFCDNYTGKSFVLFEKK